MSEDKKIGDMTLKELHQANTDIGMKFLLLAVVVVSIMIFVFWKQYS